MYLCYYLLKYLHVQLYILPISWLFGKIRQNFRGQTSCFSRKNAVVLKYQRPNFLRPGDQPNVADPFERTVIYIAKGIKQDGIFARKHIRQGDLIAYYAGKS